MERAEFIAAETLNSVSTNEEVIYNIFRLILVDKVEDKKRVILEINMVMVLHAKEL